MITLDGYEVEGLGQPSLPATQSIVAAQSDDDHMDWDDGGVWVMMGFMGIFWIGVLALGAWAVATYARNSGRREDSAMESARRRYARGEINADEFERIKRDLG